ncbi:MAG: DsrE family protein [bacterium]
MAEEENMFVFVTHGPQEPQRCATPFYMAQIAAVMDNVAKIVFQIDGVLLMKKGVSENLVALEGGKMIIEFIREAKEAGVEMYCCSSALQLHGMTEDDLIEECDGVVGAAWMVDQAMDAQVVLNY